VWLVWKIVEESISKSGPDEIVSNDANEGAADQGTVLAVATRLLMRHAHEQVDVLDVLVCLSQLCNAL
jgi:hypothetical protein